MSEKLMFTSGSWKKSSSGEGSDVINPATGEVIATVPKANLDDVNACIQSSREAFQSKEWASIDPAQRGAYSVNTNGSMLSDSVLVNTLSKSTMFP